MKLLPREIAQISAALRAWGRIVDAGRVDPARHPVYQRELGEHKAMTPDEIETLIGRVRGEITRKQFRTWDSARYR